MIKYLIIAKILLLTFKTSGQEVIADTAYFGTAPNWVKVITYRNAATTCFLPKSDSALFSTAYKLAFTRDSLASALASQTAATYGTIANLALKAPINNATFTGTFAVPAGSIANAALANSAVANLSGTNTGDNATNSQYSGLAASKLDVSGNGGSLTGLTKTQVGLGSVDNTSDANKPVSTAGQTALNLKANITSQTFVTPVLGVATGTSLALTGNLTSSGGSIGYATGNGGTVTQATSKSTGVTLNKLTGDITLNAAALAAATIVSFTLTNSTIAATDVIILQHQTTGTFGAYTLNGRTAAGSAVITIRNNTAGSLGEAIVIKYLVVKAVVN